MTKIKLYRDEDGDTWLRLDARVWMLCGECMSKGKGLSHSGDEGEDFMTTRYRFTLRRMGS